jgi:hypothetical protein
MSHVHLHHWGFELWWLGFTSFVKEWDTSNKTQADVDLFALKQSYL